LIRNIEHVPAGRRPTAFTQWQPSCENLVSVSPNITTRLKLNWHQRCNRPK